MYEGWISVLLMIILVCDGGLRAQPGVYAQFARQMKDDLGVRPWSKHSKGTVIF